MSENAASIIIVSELNICDEHITFIFILTVYQIQNLVYV